MARCHERNPRRDLSALIDSHILTVLNKIKQKKNYKIRFLRVFVFASSDFFPSLFWSDKLILLNGKLKTFFPNSLPKKSQNVGL